MAEDQEIPQDVPSVEDGGEAGADKREHDQIGFLRRQLKKTSEELETLRRAQMSEAERVQVERDEAIKRATAAEERATSILLQSRFESAAREAGIPSDLVDLAFQAVDRTTLSIDDAGRVRGLKPALEKLAKDRPTLFGAVQRPRTPGGGNPPGGAPAGNTNQRMNDFLRGRF